MFGTLRAIFGRRVPKQPAAQPWVLVTVEFPWEDKQIRRFGTVEDVLGKRTLAELVTMLAGQRGSAEDLLPANYTLHVRRPHDDQFHTMDGQTAAGSLLDNGPQATPSAAVHQLRIQVIPCCEELAPERPRTERHSDLAEPAQEVLLQPEIASPPGTHDGPTLPEYKASAECAQPAARMTKKTQGYLRKADVLRAQLLPKIETLDFSGLFVGNFGFRGGATVDGRRVALLSPAEANRYLMLANQCRRAGEWEQAAGHYRTLIAHDPANQDFWFLLGKVEEPRGDLKQALHAFQNALRLGHASAREEIARIQSALGEAAGERMDLVSLWRPTFPSLKS
jgi:hypothetical protein